MIFSRIFALVSFAIVVAATTCDDDKKALCCTRTGTDEMGVKYGRGCSLAPEDGDSCPDSSPKSLCCDQLTSGGTGYYCSLPDTE
ncbi:hypothetical protein BV22DRAFT_1131898 [Leucogyrophana mollusca]|uniref:Uncharacterized protein n=1 Tax=Leucogyrophana mollusca TaxID=85980 RepID=A0ACB8B9J5_9AGAM|nr:hypothetical protein BV22DRAFT_1131898 [Leucogyrophana mollusca]